MMEVQPFDQNSNSILSSSFQHKRMAKSSSFQSRRRSSNNMEVIKEAQFEKLSKEMELERQSVARQLEKVKTSSDAASVSSVSDTDDSFVWRAHGGSEIDSDNESQNSSALVDSYLRALEDRKVGNMGDTSMGSISENRGSVTKTTTTRRVVQNQSYTSANGDEYAIPDVPGILQNPTFQSVQNGPKMDDSQGERLVRTPSNASSLSYRSGRGDPYTASHSTVVTSVTADGALVTTYTTRTTTVQEEPTRITKQYIVKTSSDQPEYDEAVEGGTGLSRSYSGTKVTRHFSSSSSTLPREVPRVELPKPTGPATLPRDYRPAMTSTPEFFEEETINPDGSVTRVKKVISSTTHVMENDEPVVEVTISPMEMQREMSTKTTTITKTTNRSEKHDTSVDRDVRSPRSPNGYLVEETTTTTTTSSRGDRADGQYSSEYQRDDSYHEREDSFREGSLREGGSLRSSTRDGSLRDGGSLRSSTRDESLIQSSSVRSSTRDESLRQGGSLRSSTREGSVKESSVRDGSTTEEVMVRSLSRGSSGRSSAKTPTDRPPAYGYGASATATTNGGYVTEEMITTETTSKVESSAGGGAFGEGGAYGEETSILSSAQAAAGAAVNVSYAEDEKKVQHEYEIDLLDLSMFLRTDDLALKANAAGYIQHLCYKDENIKIKIRELDIIPLLVQLLLHPDEDCHRNAAGALKNLSYGKYLDDNKAVIQECGGIPACVKLLYSTNSLEVREYVTGILYNLSSAVQCRAELLDESVEAVAVLIVLPLSGWERSLYLDGRLPCSVIWSTLLRNAIGVLRNTSAAGIEGRQKIRRQEGLVDALVWMLRAALASSNSSEMNNKVIENIVCTLRNLSYRVDKEIDRERHTDAIKVEDKVDSPTILSNEPVTTSSNGKGGRPGDSAGTGCIFMKKKPERLSRKNRKKAKEVSSPVAPAEKAKYLRPQRDHPPLGVELLWDPETVDLYIEVLKKSINPVTLEAGAGAIHNLIACQWNWAAFLRTHVRKQEGLRPLFELLTVEQEYVVRAVALCLRNLSLEDRNKQLTGKYAMQELVAVLPLPSSPEGEEEPSEYTICSILGTLQVLTHASYDNCKQFYDHGGVKRVIALTREKDPKREKPLRTYSQRVVLDANRVLMQVWHFKQFQDPIKKELWSHSKATEEEKAYKTATLKQPPKAKRDNYAEMEEKQTDIPLRRDARRFVMIEDKDDDDFDYQAGTLPSKGRLDNDEKPAREEIEMRERPPAYESREEEPLVSGKSTKEKKDKKKKSKKGSTSSRLEEDEDEVEGETTPLYSNPIYKGKTEKDDDKVKLQDGSQADSWV